MQIEKLIYHNTEQDPEQNIIFVEQKSEVVKPKDIRTNIRKIKEDIGKIDKIIIDHLIQKDKLIDIMHAINDDKAIPYTLSDIPAKSLIKKETPKIL